MPSSFGGRVRLGNFYGYRTGGQAGEFCGASKLKPTCGTLRAADPSASTTKLKETSLPQKNPTCEPTTTMNNKQWMNSRRNVRKTDPKPPI